MRDKLGRFTQGQSGNPGGRPPRGYSLVDVLITSLERKKGSKTLKQILIDNLVDMATGERELKAIIKIVEILEGRYQFDTKMEIYDKLDEIQDFLENHGSN